MKKEKICLPHNSPDCEQCFSGSVENSPDETNFLQVGRNIECGSCHPEKFEDCISIQAKYGHKCNCICHDENNMTTIEEIIKEFEEKFNDILSFHESQTGESERENMKNFLFQAFDAGYEKGFDDRGARGSEALGVALKLVKEARQKILEEMEEELKARNWIGEQLYAIGKVKDIINRLKEKK